MASSSRDPLSRYISESQSRQFFLNTTVFCLNSLEEIKKTYSLLRVSLLSLDDLTDQVTAPGRRPSLLFFFSSCDDALLIMIIQLLVVVA